MGKRNIRIPGEEELNKDQDRILALPEDGQYLIIGGPGTGKSVVALLRALKYHDNNDYVFLVYNKVLSVLLEQLLNMKSNNHLTIFRWFYNAYKQLSKTHVPKIITNHYASPDYNVMIEELQALELSERSLHIIIDEGQDMPSLFYETLQHAGYKNFFIVADQNQQITEAHSSRQDLTSVLGLKPDDIIELRTNYRNSYPIGLFARHFHTDKASPVPILPDRQSLETPVLYRMTNHDNAYDMILREADMDDRKLIGIIVANNKVRTAYVQGLRKHDIHLDHTRAVVSTYASSDKSMNLDFSQGGVVVLNDKSIKGLEFDSVYIILDDFKVYNNGQDSMKKRLYVMSSRSIEKLTLVTTQKESSLLSLLPEDENVMRKIDVCHGSEKPPKLQMPDDIPFL